jgi:hypothetical protein
MAVLSTSVSAKHPLFAGLSTKAKLAMDGAPSLFFLLRCHYFFWNFV